MTPAHQHLRWFVILWIVLATINLIWKCVHFSKEDETASERLASSLLAMISVAFLSFALYLACAK